MVRKIGVFLLALLCLSLVACNQDKVDPEPKKQPTTWNKEQVMKKVGEQIQKQTKLAPVELMMSEITNNEWKKVHVIHLSDKNYYFQKFDNKQNGVQVYQLPGKQYVLHIPQSRNWQVSSVETSFQEKYVKDVTPSGTMQELLPNMHVAILSAALDNVQMKTNTDTYELQLPSTEANAKLVEKTLQAFSPTEDITFTKYESQLTIDKKTFAIEAIKNQISATRKTKDGVKDVTIKLKVTYPAMKELKLPEHVLKKAS